MAKLAHKSARNGSSRAPSRTRTKARDLPIPRKLSDPDFEEICRLHQISAADRAQLLIEINAIIKDIAAWMRKQRHEPKGVQAKRLIAAAKAVRKARDWLDVDTDRVVLSFADEILAPMISPVWLRQQFPADERAPAPLGLAPIADDQSSLQQRKEFIENRPVETLVAVFKTIEAGFADSLMMRLSLPGAKGGGKPLFQRRAFIIMVAIKWERLGKQVSTSPNSDFIVFIDNIMDAIGWPSDLGGESSAVATAVGDAIQHWRNLRKK
jgi:hypothetical protein